MAAAGKTTMIISMITMAICMGCQPLLAYSYGAGDSKRLKQLLKDLILLTVVFWRPLAGAASFSRTQCADRDVHQGRRRFPSGERSWGLSGSGQPGDRSVLSGKPICCNLWARQAVRWCSLLRQGLLLIPLLYLMNALCGVQGIAAAPDSRRWCCGYLCGHPAALAPGIGRKTAEV